MTVIYTLYILYMFVPRFYEVSNERHYLGVVASLSFTIDCCINTLETKLYHMP